MGVQLAELKASHSRLFGDTCDLEGEIETKTFFPSLSPNALYAQPRTLLAASPEEAAAV